MADSPDGPMVAEMVEEEDLALDIPLEESLASLRSSILNYRKENGRTYHSVSDGKYVLPNDNLEQDRLDLVNHLFVLTFDGRQCMCPKNDGAKRVLDLGTGTGIWALDFADAHPEAEVVGIDLSPIQPTFVPTNCSFEVDDIEKAWTWSKQFDLIFARSMIASFADWSSIVAKAYQQLEPGGYFEIQDNNFPIRCDDGTLPDDTPILKWTQLLIKATDEIGRPITVAPKFKSLLEEAGFEEVVETKRRWAHAPWPKDPKLKELGLWSQAASLQGVEAITLALFTRVLGWSQEETMAFCGQVQSDLKNRSIHGYWEVYSVYGRKPLASGKGAT